jgi:hypothetical protein
MSTAPAEQSTPAGGVVDAPDDMLAHLVLKDSWPIALCGARVKYFIGDRAPGRDRCPACLRACVALGLGRPAWNKDNPT